MLELITALHGDECDHLLEEFEEKLIGQPMFKEALRAEVNSFRLFNETGDIRIL